MWFKDANILICGIDVLGGVAKIGPSSGQRQTAGGTGRWFPPFSYDIYVLKWFTYNDILLNHYWMMKRW